jgi:hypothetical protein
MAIRMNLRGSMFSSPEAGQPEEHSPQVRQASKLAPGGSKSSAACLKLIVGIAVCAMLMVLLAALDVRPSIADAIASNPQGIARPNAALTTPS